MGYLKGTPKILNMENTKYDFLKQKDGYFIRIQITKLHKHRQFALLYKLNDNGVCVVTNALGGDIVEIDKAGLDVLTTFHKT